jgi:NAD(P)H-dependent FMN reductase
MTTKPRIAIVIGSTRPGRYADKAASWMLKQTRARDDIETELLDLLDHQLPFFDEKGPLMSMPSENAEALRWQETLARYDGFVFVVAEYNHSITGVLKNALDQAYKEWGRKPFTAIGYGGNGAARAVEHLRLIAIAPPR